MRVVQYIKRVNNTELGRGSTHETYILVTEKVDVSEFFRNPNVQTDFIFKRDCKKKYTLTLTNKRETRINGLGEFYSENFLYPGDEVLLEVVENNGVENRYIDFNKHNNRIVLQKIKNDGFSVLTPNYQSLINSQTKVLTPDGEKKLEIVYIRDIRKRSDSPDSTPIYNILIDEKKNIKDHANIKNNEMIQLDIRDNIARISIVNTWEKYTFEI